MDLSKAKLEELTELIKSVSFANNKAKHLLGMAKLLVEEYDSVVPDDVVALQRMPGVGRKTANVITSVIYHQPNMAVDTHVFRVADRIGLTTNAKTPLQTELQLIKELPEALIHRAHHWLILHGRYTCIARKPKCSSCGIAEACRFYEKEKKKNAE
jgi:endonuclease-3